MEQKKQNNALSGVDNCDVIDCDTCIFLYCKNEVAYSSSKAGTGSVTPQPSSGSITPKETSGKGRSNKTAKNLKKVKRALKTLGVNFLHFDEENDKNGQNVNQEQCEKDFCRLGCICESLNGK